MSADRAGKGQGSTGCPQLEDGAWRERKQHGSQGRRVRREQSRGAGLSSAWPSCRGWIGNAPGG